MVVAMIMLKTFLFKEESQGDTLQKNWLEFPYESDRNKFKIVFLIPQIFLKFE